MRRSRLSRMARSSLEIESDFFRFFSGQLTGHETVDCYAIIASICIRDRKGETIARPRVQRFRQSLLQPDESLQGDRAKGEQARDIGDEAKRASNTN